MRNRMRNHLGGIKVSDVLDLQESPAQISCTGKCKVEKPRCQCAVETCDVETSQMESVTVCVKVEFIDSVPRSIQNSVDKLIIRTSFHLIDVHDFWGDLTYVLA